MKIRIKSKANQPRKRPNQPPSQQRGGSKHTTSQRSRQIKHDPALTHNRRSVGAKVSHRHRFIWRHVPFYVITSLIIGLTVYIGLVDRANPHIRVTYAGEDTAVDAEDDIARIDAYEAAATAALHESVLNHTKFTMQQEAVEAAIEDQFPEVLVASVRLQVIDRSPIVRVLLRTPQLLLQTSDSSESYYVDDSGFIIGEAIEASERSLLTVVDEVGLELEPGTRVLPLDTIEFIEALQHQFNWADLQVAELALPAIANELHVRISGDNYIGKFDITASPRTQAGVFMATRDKLRSDNSEPSEYIDARVQGRAYYQ